LEKARQIDSSETWCIEDLFDLKWYLSNPILLKCQGIAEDHCYFQEFIAKVLLRNMCIIHIISFSSLCQGSTFLLPPPPSGLLYGEKTEKIAPAAPKYFPLRGSKFTHIFKGGGGRSQLLVSPLLCASFLI